MIPQHDQHGNFDRHQFLSQHRRLFELTIVNQIAA